MQKSTPRDRDASKWKVESCGMATWAGWEVWFGALVFISDDQVMGYVGSGGGLGLVFSV